MIRLLGICIALLLVLWISINAAVMLASPRRWFHLPAWLRLEGSLTEDKYSIGWGAVQIRLTGAALLALIAWVLYDMLLRRHT